MNIRYGFLPTLAAGLILASGQLLAAKANNADTGITIDSYTFGGMKARAIGPAVMSGRISALDAVPGPPATVYVGAASGGLWKSTDGGIGFKPVFDDHTQSIGAIKIAPSDAKTVWVGTGESWVRNTVSVGAGAYLSTDGGEKWQHKGLDKTERIAAIEVSPRDANTAFVCATGALWSDSPHRGVYKTTDGGGHWKKVLYVNEKTGCSDLAMDPANPNILYAGMWQFRRYPDFFESGGPGSALYRSVDGGESWDKMTNGLPPGNKGRIALAVAPSQPGTVYATVESDDTALYRSDNLGKNWQRRSTAGAVQMRPFYFGELKIDPENPDRVYKPSFNLVVSDDGGKSFSSLFGAGFSLSIHPDHHALWINPKDPNQLFLGTDGGVYVSENKGGNWRLVGTLPVSQFYHVSHDSQWPYNVYGGLQDNGSWMGPSRAPGGIGPAEWDSVGYGDGFWVFVDPQDENIIYSEYQGGNLLRVDRQLKEVKNIAPAARAGEEKLRFNWNTPLLVSQSTPGTIYYGSQYLHKSTDRGESWQTISPDLTTDDPKRQRQMKTGGLTIDNSTAENNATLYTIAESPLDGKILWTGSDDGLIHVSRDGGTHWQEVGHNLKGVPKGTWVSRITTSAHHPGTAFATLDGHRSGDMRLYAFRTDDFGKHWQPLSSDGVEGYAWVLKQDPVNEKLLFLGSEHGLYLSLDGGQHWARFKENLPKVAVHDIVIHPTEHDVILATHGRGVYIIDDITPIRALTADMLQQDVILLPSRPSVQMEGGALQHFSGGEDFVGENPEEAATIAYYLKKRHLFGDMKLEIHDQQGQLITTLPAGKRRGINRVAWPMRLKPPKYPPSTALVPGMVGPRVAEGTYQVRLIKGDKTLDGEVSLVADPRSKHSPQDRQLQQQLSMQLYNAINDLTFTVNQLQDLQKQLAKVKDKLPKSARKKIQAFSSAVDDYVYQVAASGKAGWISGEEKLRERLGTLYGAVSGYSGRPTQTQFERAKTLTTELDEAKAQAARLLSSHLPKINHLLEKNHLPAVKPMERHAWDNKNGFSSSTASTPFTRAWLGQSRLFSSLRSL